MRWSVLPLVLVGAACSAAPVVYPPISPAPRAPAALAPPTSVAVPEPPPAASACARRAPAARVTPLSPTGVGGAVVLVAQAGRKLAYVADEDERAVRTVDLASRAEIAVTPLDAAPGQLVVTTDGRLLVALRTASAVAVFEPGDDPATPLEARCTVSAPAEPTGLALTPDGERLLVTSRWGHALTAYETGTLKAAFTVDLPRDPLAVVTSSDGARAFVSHVVGARLSVVDLHERAARQVDLHQVERQQAFSSGKPVTWSTGQGYTLARTASGRIFAPEILANPNPTPGEVTSGYGAGTGAPSQIGDIASLDEAGEHLATTPVLDFRDHADCLLPRAAAVDEGTSRLLVACLGVNSILAYDAKARNPHLRPLARWSVAAGPTGIAVDLAERRAIVWSQFDHTLSFLALDGPAVVTTSFTPPATFSTPHPLSLYTDAPVKGRIIAVVLPAHAPPMDATLALGRRVFHAAGDAQLSGDGRACASCHPDGRDDGFTWSTPDGPRQTPILAARLADTAPYGWNGASARLEDHVHRTFQRLSGFGLAPRSFAALVAYVRHMDLTFARPAPSAEAARGEAIFLSAEAACATCHVDVTTADGKAHDVQSKIKGDRTAGFDTPSLRFLGQSAPYFHDGRYATLGDLLRGVDGTMGHTAHLDDGERRALEAYLEAL
ncbi:MAG: cytochrome C peroxidase [Byssovorax sp.]